MTFSPGRRCPEVADEGPRSWIELATLDPGRGKCQDPHAAVPTTLTRGEGRIARACANPRSYPFAPITMIPVRLLLGPGRGFASPGEKSPKRMGPSPVNGMNGDQPIRASRCQAKPNPDHGPWVRSGGRPLRDAVDACTPPGCWATPRRHRDVVQETFLRLCAQDRDPIEPAAGRVAVHGLPQPGARRLEEGEPHDPLERRAGPSQPQPRPGAPEVAERASRPRGSSTLLETLPSNQRRSSG